MTISLTGCSDSVVDGEIPEPTEVGTEIPESKTVEEHISGIWDAYNDSRSSNVMGEQEVVGTFSEEFKGELRMAINSTRLALTEVFGSADFRVIQGDTARIRLTLESANWQAVDVDGLQEKTERLQQLMGRIAGSGGGDHMWELTRRMYTEHPCLMAMSWQERQSHLAAFVDVPGGDLGKVDKCTAGCHWDACWDVVGVYGMSIILDIGCSAVAFVPGLGTAAAVACITAVFAWGASEIVGIRDAHDDCIKDCQCKADPNCSSGKQ